MEPTTSQTFVVMQPTTINFDEDDNKRWLEEQTTFFMEATKAFLSKKKCQLITQSKKEEIINVIASWDSLGKDMQKEKHGKRNLNL